MCLTGRTVPMPFSPCRERIFDHMSPNSSMVDTAQPRLQIENPRHLNSSSHGIKIPPEFTDIVKNPSTCQANHDRHVNELCTKALTPAYANAVARNGIDMRTKKNGLRLGGFRPPLLLTSSSLCPKETVAQWDSESVAFSQAVLTEPRSFRMNERLGLRHCTSLRY